MAYNLTKVTGQFQIEGTFRDGGSYGSGHINDTFLINTDNGTNQKYILQRVNHHVFKNVPQLMKNIERVTTHTREKLRRIPGSNPDRETLTLIPTRDKKTYYQDDEGNFWRVYLFIENTRSYDIVDDQNKAYEGGKAFGRFQKMLADLPGGPLYETIPDFHNTEKRLQNFRETVTKDPLNRAGEAAQEIEFVHRRADEMTKIIRLGREGKIPLRTTHNDTKFNNVLLTEDDKGLCVIDLDTVMPGYALYDFGDSIRTVTNTGAEDEKDLNKVRMKISFFEAYARGFLSETLEFLTPNEIDLLAFAGKLFPFIIGLRFLTDHLDGDNYFKIHFPGHNLQRARAQFKLLQSMEEQFEAMNEVIGRIVEEQKKGKEPGARSQKKIVGAIHELPLGER